jgi:hypothetical protein
MIKKILLTAASIFLIWQSYNLITQIHHVATDNWGVIIFVGWVLNMFITGIFAFAVFAYPAQRLLPQSYYKIKRPERLKKWFQILKVEVFRRFLLATFWRNKAQQKRYFNGKKEGLNNLIMQAESSEFGHILPFLLLGFLTVYLITIGLWKLAIATFLFNIIGNFYPVLLQRHHRMRIERILKRLA